MFELFWQKLRGRQREREYIRTNVVVTKKPSADDPERKKEARHYHLTVSEGDEVTQINVCKTMFLATLDICDSWVETVLKKKVGAGGTLSPEKRGNTQPRPNTISEHTVESVRRHIGLFELQVSLWPRGQQEVLL